MFRRHNGVRTALHGLRAVLVVAALNVTPLPASAQSLGELALREAERRAAVAAARAAVSQPPVSTPVSLPLRPAPVPPTVPAKAGPDVARLPPAASRPAALAPVRAAAPAATTVGTPPLLTGTGADRAPVNPRVVAAPSPAAQTPTLAGWSGFTVKKTASELIEGERLNGLASATAKTRARDNRPPPQHDVMRLSTGVSYLQGADFGADMSGAGKVNGMLTDVSGFLTAGREGLEMRSGRISVFTPDGGWRGEAGNLFSDLRGLAHGGRASWNLGQKWSPSISVYLPRSTFLEQGATVLAYRDRVQLLPSMRLGGEFATDRGRFVQLQYARRGVEATGFYRFVAGAGGGRDQGISGGVALWRGITVNGAVRVSNATDDSRQWQMASVRVPLARQATITLERSWWDATANGGYINAVAFQLPLGPLRLIQRLQWGHTDYLQRAVPYGFDQRQSQTTASYTAGRWGRLNYQQSTQWFEDGRSQQWDEMMSSVQLGRSTTAEFVTAFPDVSDPARLRARLTRQLSPTLALEVQYGRLSAFQRSFASRDEQSRFMLTFRKTWQVQTPSRGGIVSGFALDQAGAPVSGARVTLGPYSTITDDRGAYAFKRVPHGELDLSLDKEGLPADYALDEKPQRLSVERGRRTSVTLQVIPLSAIRGRVYQDRNRNARFDEGEGVPNAVVAVNGKVTATGPTGSYAFYNQPPGRYQIRLDVQRLAKGLAAVSPPLLDVELTAEKPLLGADFLVERRDMPVIMRDIGR